VRRRPGAHSSQAFRFDREARQALRSVDLPNAEARADRLGPLASA
jgi:hypothetical protein